ncbi:HupE/UreJ family protein [Sulfurovum sp. CS9]|uniref:HupE/UreJ family protein n=1 Tax=Sulfurovum sp. CS9 TaxID=3391146 RepID=UPI0039E9A953
MMRTLALLFVLLFHTVNLMADEVRPAYLEVKEIKQNIFALILKVPAKGSKKLNIKAELPKECTNTTPVSTHFVNNAYLERWSVKCEDGLVGKTLALKGLNTTNTDLLLRLEFMNVTSQSILLTPTKTSYQVPQVTSSLQVVKTYTWLGITHILMGFDHLLFVFALLLIVKSMRRLLWTITAFTLAHSITMAGATLGFIHVPQEPVEAMIALSILFLAMEIVHEKQGKVGLTSRYPWVIAFIFGLLHGFGFAGALAEIGLPEQAITLALIFFNIGVELGQLMFVVTIVLIGLALHALKHPNILQKVETIVVYAIGGLSSFWVIERISAF